MSTTEPNKSIPQAGDQASSKKRQRSPSYPFTSLERSIKLATALWEKEKRHPATIPVVCGHWEMSAKSSAGLLSVAALKKFDLLTEEGSGGSRTVRLSDFALDIIKHAEVPEEFSKLVKVAALKPEIHRDLWTTHREASDASIRRYLVFDRKFNDNVVDAVIKVYRDTISFAKLTSADTFESPENDEEEALPSRQSPVSSITQSPAPPRPLTVNLPLNEVVTEHTTLTREYRIPLDDENDVEIRFFGSEFGIPQIDALSDFMAFIKKQLERKAGVSPKTPTGAP